MPLPADWQTCEIRWRGVELDGDAVTGKIECTPAVGRFYDPDPSVPTLIITRTLSFNIVAGTCTFNLPCTDDPDVSPTNFTWQIKETIDGGGGQTYDIEVPLSAIPLGIDLPGVAPVEVSPGTPLSLVTREEFDNTLPGITIVEHGTDPNVARPSTPLVYWIGTVLPNNAQPYDLYWDET